MNKENKLDTSLTVEEFAKEYTGVKVTAGGYTGIIAGSYDYGTKEILLIDVEGLQADDSDSNWGVFVKITKHWEGSKATEWLKYPQDFIRVVDTPVEPEPINPMPELKAGMVVEVTDSDDGEVFGNYLYINDNWTLSLDGESWQDLCDSVRVSKVYSVETCDFEAIPDNLILIWEEETPSQKEIKALEQVIKEAQEKINLLRGNK